MKITEELRVEWSKEFKVQQALGTIKDYREYYYDRHPFLFNVRYVTSYDGAESPATMMCPRHASVRALHAHHAVSLMLDRTEPLMNRFEYLEVSCNGVKWQHDHGWNVVFDLDINR